MGWIFRLKVKVKEFEQYKTIFITPWGMYVYVRIPFGLNNIGAIFQKAIDVVFIDLINIIMVMINL